MVLPAPGGPMRMTLWPPAAASSSERLMFCCPFTSAEVDIDQATLLAELLARI
jgi:hypothetical protein